MTIAVTNAGNARLASNAIGLTTAEALALYLFTNSVTPTDQDTAGTYVAAVGGGFGPPQLPMNQWTVTPGTGGTAGSPGTPTVLAFPVQTFNFTGNLTGPQNVVGYFLVGAVSGMLYGAEDFPAPFTPVAGGSYQVTPRLTFQSVA